MYKHKLSNIRPDEKLGDCAECGPDARLRYRQHRAQWACRTADRQRSEASRQRRVRRFTTPGMTHDLYEQMLAEQGAVCAICGGVNKSGRALAADHCHDTGRIRGLPCGPCNAALGLMCDDPERLLRAIGYIETARDS